MCAIAGGNNQKDVEKMLELMKHRAPDGMGVISDDQFSIGMGRLAIIDLKSDGLCPYREDNFVLSFNGEIYNYIELREELKKIGWKFKTTSDIEVVMKSYREWGVGCLNKFNGMFAFAIYDGRNVFLARDIAGEKPLYYWVYPFKFASEAKALHFECVEMPPAHYVIYNLFTKEFKRYKYWSIKKRKIDLKNAEKELELLLEDSIRLRTRSDVPYGIYLSGGVDSTLISTFHNFKHKFTYEDKDYSKEFKKFLPKIVWHLDYPVNSFSAFGLWKLANQASKKVKVVLSGEGADELFGGYVRYIKPHFNYLVQQKYPSYKTMHEPAHSVSESGLNEFYGNMQELLRMADRMSSAFGIESRCPFLDKRIIEFAFSLPDEFKINYLDTKVILNRILKKRFPEYKPIEKAGLYCSVNEWMNVYNKFDKKKYLEEQITIWRKFQ